MYVGNLQQSAFSWTSMGRFAFVSMRLFGRWGISTHWTIFSTFFDKQKVKLCMLTIVSMWCGCCFFSYAIGIILFMKGLLENTDKDRIKRLVRLKPPTEFWPESSSLPYIEKSRSKALSTFCISLATRCVQMLIYRILACGDD